MESDFVHGIVANEIACGAKEDSHGSVQSLELSVDEPVSSPSTSKPGHH